ncbi:MAG: hypothetical protein PVF58_09475 [Candidatus Methanofastidiosia archaeon]
METTLIRLVCYVIDIIVCFLLVGYFIREYMIKKLRASLAWAVGFFLFSLMIISLASYTTIDTVSKIQVMVAFVLASSAVSSLYYGAALIYFGEKSFFREKMTSIFFVGIIIIGSILTAVTDKSELVSTVGNYTNGIFLLVYVVIGSMFFAVSRKLPGGDPRKRAINMVGIAWYIVAIWNTYVGLFWGEDPLLEAGMFLLGSFGFLLLLYGMTTGKATRT